MYFCLLSQFSALYIVSFVIITVGFIMFNAVPTYTPLTDEPADHSADPASRSASAATHLLTADRESPGTEAVIAVAAL